MEEKRTEQIVDSVAKLFLEYGIRGVTMDDIAHRLSISKKTLYEYFKDKKDLVEAVLESTRCTFSKAFEEYKSEKLNAIDEVFHYFDMQKKMIRSNRPAFIYDLKKYYPELYSKYQNFKHKMMYDHVMSNLKRGIEEGFYRKDINPDIITRNNLMRIECMISSDFFTVDEFMSTELFEELFKYHLYGIASDKGREIVHEKFKLTEQ